MRQFGGILAVIGLSNAADSLLGWTPSLGGSLLSGAVGVAVWMFAILREERG